MKSAGALALLLLAIGFVPLFGGPRYEAALVCGLLGPLWVGIASAANARQVERNHPAPAASATPSASLNLLSTVLRGGVDTAILHVLVVFGVALFHGVRVGFCEPAPGFALLALGPGVGMLLAGLWGAGLGSGLSLLGRRGGGVGWTVLVGAAPPLLALGWGLYDFYATPSVYAYSPFVGYFSGPLYDTVEYDIPRLLVYRAGTLLSLGAVATLAPALELVRAGRAGRFARVRFHAAGRAASLLLGVLFLGASTLHTLSAARLGYRSSAASMREHLGREAVVGRCRVYFSSAIPTSDARRLAQECVGHLAAVEQYFGSTPLPHVDIYLFATTEEKRLQMGAGTTYIAKPWRREVYLSQAGFPHPVLGHELAHVVTGQFGQGPLLVAGPLGGWFPDPGRIEGFAEAASLREHSEGTLHEWTSAMRHLDLLPRASQLFQLGFLANSAARSYSASGSFVDFIHQRHGASVLRRWYHGASLVDLTRQSWPELEKQWHLFLDATVVPADVMEIARPRFSHPGVFERRCPHAVDRAVSGALGYCAVDEKKARELAARAVKLDPTRSDVQLAMGRCAWFSGDAERSMRELSRGAQDEEHYDPGARRAAWEFAGDVAWNESRVFEAKTAYNKARKLTFGRDQRRQLDVKLWTMEQPAPVQEPILRLLAPAPDSPHVELALLSNWAASGPEADFARYLLGRAYVGAGADLEAEALFTSIDPAQLPLPSVRREALRSTFINACSVHLRRGNQVALQAAYDKYTHEKLSRAERVEAERLMQRCRAIPLRELGTSASLGP